MKATGAWMTAHLATQGVRRHLWRAWMVVAAAVWWLLFMSSASHAQDDVLPDPATAEGAPSLTTTVASTAEIGEIAVTSVDAGTSAGADTTPAVGQPSPPVPPPTPTSPPVAQPVRQLVRQTPEPVRSVVDQALSPVLDKVEGAATVATDTVAPTGATAAVDGSESGPESRVNPGPVTTPEESDRAARGQGDEPRTGWSPHRAEKDVAGDAGAGDTNRAARQAPRRSGQLPMAAGSHLDVRAEAVRTAVRAEVRAVPQSEIPPFLAAGEVTEERTAGTERTGSSGGAVAHLQQSLDIWPLGSSAQSTRQVQRPPQDRAEAPDHRPD